jgi:hypothetical protein
VTGEGHGPLIRLVELEAAHEIGLAVAVEQVIGLRSSRTAPVPVGEEALLPTTGPAAKFFSCSIDPSRPSVLAWFQSPQSARLIGCPTLGRRRPWAGQIQSRSRRLPGRRRAASPTGPEGLEQARRRYGFVGVVKSRAARVSIGDRAAR